MTEQPKLLARAADLATATAENERLRAQRDQLLAALKEIDEVSFLHHAQRLARAAIAAVEERHD